jgi:hypothetical protein
MSALPPLAGTDAVAVPIAITGMMGEGRFVGYPSNGLETMEATA